MKKIITILTACVLTVSFAAPAVAADKKKKKVPNVVRVPKGIELTADQKTKIEALNKEFGPKLAECKAKANSIITADQKKARTEAMKKAKADGKKGKELRAAVTAAVAITADQKAKQAESKKAMGALNKEIRTQFAALLTDEQKAKIKGGKKKKN
jgi:Spy/CpxP family protein refolding chaperone